MEKLYASTFITGFSDIVQSELMENLEKVSIAFLGDGIVLYTTETAIKTIQRLPFINNTYVVFQYFEDPDTRIDDMMKEVLDNYKFYNQMPLTISKSKATFRLIASYANRMVGMKPQLKKKLETKISRQLKIKLDRVHPKTEFWFISRKEGIHFFGLKITQHPDYTKSLPPGALRPELAHLLCSIGGMSEQDVFLDPFAGFGAIPLARKKRPFRKMIVSDSNHKIVKSLHGRLRVKKTTIQQDDALHLHKIDDNTITHIVTDPPWGKGSAQSIDFVWFYGKMLDAFERVLVDGGSCVILTGNPKALEKALRKTSFTVDSLHTTLVSGKKASVYSLKNNLHTV